MLVITHLAGLAHTTAKLDEKELPQIDVHCNAI